MSTESPRALHSLSRRRLALGLAAALSCSLSTARAATEMPSDMSVMMERLPYVHERSRSEMPASKRTPTRPGAMTHFVDTCADDGSPNSLRSLLELSPNVQSGDTIDLTQLPMMCSKITLSNTFADIPLTVTQDTLYLKGPGADQLTIDANGYSSVIRHYGYGTLQIEGVTIANGYHKTAGPPSPLPRGGCLFSTGGIALISSVITHCEAVSISVGYSALGGALFVQGDARMYFSSIVDSSATGLAYAAAGGAAYVVGNIVSHYSLVANNLALAPPPYFSDAGGISAAGAVTILGSTISNNRADFDAGILIGRNYLTSSSITNSTITGNVADIAVGGIFAQIQPIVVSNSTIAFNEARGQDGGAGIFFTVTALTLRSSIVAANFNGLGPADIDGDNSVTITASSKDNLINAIGSLSLPGTITECARLDPLLNNGGPTPTHALHQTSPAIDKGDNDVPLDSDQRQKARVTGLGADIGAFERTSTDRDERIFLGRFDGKCEW